MEEKDRIIKTLRREVEKLATLLKLEREKNQELKEKKDSEELKFLPLNEIKVWDLDLSVRSCNFILDKCYNCRTLREVSVKDVLQAFEDKTGAPQRKKGFGKKSFEEIRKVFKEILVKKGFSEEEIMRFNLFKIKFH